MWFQRFSAPLSKGHLVCFHHAGGSPNVFRSWIDWLEPDIEIIAIELPGHGVRSGEPLMTTSEEIATALVPHLLPLFDKPMFFLGHSMGAAIAFETVQQLAEVGAVPEHFYVVGAYPPCKKHQEYVSLKPDEVFLQDIKKLGGIPAAFLADEEFVAYMLPILRNDLRLAETYYCSPKQFPCSVTVFAGENDILSIDELTEWKKMNPPQFSMGIYKGGHFFLHEDNQVFLGDLRKSLYQQLLSIDRRQQKWLDHSS